jgi:hypothetical protein
MRDDTVRRIVIYPTRVDSRYPIRAVFIYPIRVLIYPIRAEFIYPIRAECIYPIRAEFIYPIRAEFIYPSGGGMICHNMVGAAAVMSAAPIMFERNIIALKTPSDVFQDIHMVQKYLVWIVIYMTR